MLFTMMFYENDELSLTRVISASGYLLFAFVSIYLVLHQQKWDNYETFAIFSGGGGAATQVANKFVNGKYNSVRGGYSTSDPQKFEQVSMDCLNVMAPSVGDHK